MSYIIHPADSFDTAMNKVCLNLPPPWQIHVELEKGCGSVKLIDPEGREVSELAAACSTRGTDPDSLADSLNDALEFALRCEKLAGICIKCGLSVFHRQGAPGEYDHDCQPLPAYPGQGSAFRDMPD